MSPFAVYTRDGPPLAASTPQVALNLAMSAPLTNSPFPAPPFPTPPFPTELQMMSEIAGYLTSMEDEINMLRAERDQLRIEKEGCVCGCTRVRSTAPRSGMLVQLLTEWERREGGHREARWCLNTTLKRQPGAQ